MVVDRCRDSLPGTEVGDRAVGAEGRQDTGRFEVGEPVHSDGSVAAQTLLVHPAVSTPETIEHGLDACGHGQACHFGDVHTVEHLGMLEAMSPGAHGVDAEQRRRTGHRRHDHVGRTIADDVEARLQTRGDAGNDVVANLFF